MIEACARRVLNNTTFEGLQLHLQEKIWHNVLNYLQPPDDLNLKKLLMDLTDLKFTVRFYKNFVNNVYGTKMKEALKGNEALLKREQIERMKTWMKDSGTLEEAQLQIDQQNEIIARNRQKIRVIASPEISEFLIKHATFFFPSPSPSPSP